MAIRSTRRKLPPMIRPIPVMFLLVLASVALACDSEVEGLAEFGEQAPEEFRAAPIAGEEFGPCIHDDATEPTYHWCTPPLDESLPTLVCAIPQAPNEPAATVCLAVQKECPIAMAADGVGYPVVQDHAKACAISCVDDYCPSDMSCIAGICAWETF